MSDLIKEYQLNNGLWENQYYDEGVQIPNRPEESASILDVSPEVRNLMYRTNRNIQEREKQKYYTRTGRNEHGRLMGEKPLQSEDWKFAAALAGLRGPVKQTFTTMFNPAKASTDFGAALATAADAAGVYTSGKGLRDLHRKWESGNFHHEDIPTYALNLMGLTPAINTAVHAAPIMKSMVKPKATRVAGKIDTEYPVYDPYEHDSYESFILDDPAEVSQTTRTLTPTIISNTSRTPTIRTIPDDVLDAKIDEIINSHYSSNPLAFRDALTRDIQYWQRYMEREVGIPFDDAVDNYYYLYGQFVPREQAVNFLRTKGFSDKGIDSILNEQSKYYRGDIRRFLINDFGAMHPKFSEATNDYRIKKLATDPKYVTDELLNHFRLVNTDAEADYELIKTPFEIDELPAIQAVIDKYSKVPLKVQDLFDDPNALPSLRKDLRESVYRNLKMPGDINNMAWHQGGYNNGFLSKAPQLTDIGKKDAFKMMSNLPRGYRLAETNTSFDSEMLKLLGVQRAINKGKYGKGPGQITVHPEPGWNGNNAQKERFYVQDLIDKYLNELTQEDIDHLNGIILNRGRTGNGNIKKYYSPTYEAVLRKEYDALGKYMTDRLNRMYKNINNADPSLNLPNATYDPFDMDQVGILLQYNGYYTPDISKPSIQIQRNKQGGKL